MFGFPSDLFALSTGRTPSNHALIPHHQSLFGHSLMLPTGIPGLNDFFHDFSSPFTMMDRMMREAQQNTSEPIHSFTSTTVMSFNGTDGQPKVFHQSTSRRCGPGGIEETRQTVRDSERGINKVQIGHRIGDRKQIIEREMNTQTGQISEHVELENLDEDQTDEFRKEWQQRSTHLHRPHSYLPRHHHHHHHHRHRSSQSPSSAPLAIEYQSRPRSTKHSQRTSLPQPETIDLTEDNPPFAPSSALHKHRIDRRSHRQHRF